MHGDDWARIPTADECVLRNLLEAQAARQPDAVFVAFWRGESWSYRETLERVRRRAAALRAQGVRQGDHVLCWMGNGPDLLTAWFAINYLGAVYVPLNTASRGRPLEHMLDNAGATVLIAHAALIGRLAEIGRGPLARILTVGTADADPPDLPGVSIAPLVDAPADADLSLPLDRPIQPWDPHAIMYSSGTTGAAKGVVTSYVQIYTMGPDAFDSITADDRCMICGPIFHCGSTLYVYCMLGKGGSMAMVPEFRTPDFWDSIRDTRSTVVLLLGIMANFLLKAPPDARDRDHTLKKVFIVPFGEDAPRFGERFGVELHTVYNMTEIASPLTAGPRTAGPDGMVPGLCGRARPCFELRVVDGNDAELPPGTVGELIIRSHRPWALGSGYYRNPEATLASMRNGWFHTGDAFRMEADGRFFFVDRLKDVIRRRGENISSFELEAEICAHPAVREAVTVAVPSDVGEDEVLAVVAPIPGAAIDPAELVGFLAARVAHYMVPRYVRVVEELPKTASGKLQKHMLRADGLTEDCWDREAAGIRLKRERLG
ncbi:ATP-dependent acyl-CoA ligase (plasmid) [Azospirillum sp. TSA2s]|uniref:AMP-binding protein n=1 Tax=Azospirillum sp. TSA2s TaxID=709810 RepID=UPI0010AAC942|nr:AMP-binding protein [Azospirillum sp. TSA2s]QCG92890.1 ATP-dependent acyl-CoA ligase [Azospirillum sp. TSA2s]